MPKKIQDLCICIPTYKRDEYLIKLLKQLIVQTVLPDKIVIIDGDSETNTRSIFPDILKVSKNNHEIEFIYITSNHANLPYQRFLGWKYVKDLNCELLVYLDDDLIVSETDSIEKLITPMIENHSLYGTSSNISFSREKTISRNLLSNLILKFGSSKKYRSGEITPSGNRIPVTCNNVYGDVDYLSGGVMAYRLNYLKLDHFTADLFAIYERKRGKGEDTILSLRVRGDTPYKILCSNKYFSHPDNEPVAYPTDAYNKGYSIAYSRRMINDNFRSKQNTKIKDRLELLKSYIGTNILNFLHFLFSLEIKKMYYFVGYAMGTINGIFQKPTAKNLTPNIDWWEEAEDAVKNQVNIQ